MIFASAPFVVIGQDDGPEWGGGATFNELRRRTPSGAADDEIIDNWINGELKTLVESNDQREVGRKLRSKVDALRNAGDTSQLFREALHRRLNMLAKQVLERKPAWPEQAAVGLVRVLADASDVQTLEALEQAMKSDAPQVRYLGARAIFKLRDKIAQDPTALDKFIAMLRERGVAEKSGVVVEDIYRALSIGSNTEAVLDAFADILKARAEQYRQGANFANSAEVQACQFLLGVNVPQSKAVPIVQSLAVILRLDVQRYATDDLSDDEQFAIELRVDAVERLLEKLTGQVGKVRTTMQSGGLAPEIELDLLGWIGTQGSAGKLNNSPWNVAVGAP